MHHLLAVLVLACLTLPTHAALPPAQPVDAEARMKVAADYGKLPLSFEANQGQADSTVRFLARGQGYDLFLTPAEAVLALRAPKNDGGAVVRMRLAGANHNPEVSGLDPQPGTSNYFIGSDPARWRSGVPHYAKVKYSAVYPGIDLIYYGKQRQLEYDFIVAPGADPRRIALDFEGVNELSLDATGNLVLDTPTGTLVQHKPVVYQEIDGRREIVDARYVLRGKKRAAFQVARYDRGRPLVIDPVLAYSTYLGAAIYDMAVDKSGNAYVTGTAGPGLPTTGGAYQVSDSPGDSSDTFVTKLNASGTALVYSTYVGGGGNDFGNDIAVDNEGNAYITGWTEGGFPTTTGAYETSFAGRTDAFVAKLAPAGDRLVYSTYLGTSRNTSDGYGAMVNGIALDAVGNAYVTGFAYEGLPATPGAFQTAHAGDNADAFVIKLNAAGKDLAYATYLGGSYRDVGRGIAVDAEGNAYVSGQTTSRSAPGLVGFPTTPGAHKTVLDIGSDAFVAKLNAAGSDLIYSTLLGGDGSDDAGSIAIDGSGNAYVAGTTSGDFPVTAGVFQTVFGGGHWEGLSESPPIDAFVAALNASGSALIYATYLGGNGNEYVLDIAVDGGGSAHVAGRTDSTNFPTTPASAYQNSLRGSWDAYLTKLNATGAALRYSTYLGGSELDLITGIALDSSGNIYVAGQADSTDFPLTAGSYSAAPAPGFISKFTPSVGPTACPGTGLWAIIPELNGRPGRGFAIEHQGGVMYLTVFAYDAEGKPRFYQAAGLLSEDRFSGTLVEYAGGTTFGGPWQSARLAGQAGSVTLHFGDSAHGTITFPGEAAQPITKYNWANRGNSGIAPFTGLWAITSEVVGEPGRGFLVEAQGNMLILTVFAYDAAGKAAFYQATGPLENGSFTAPLNIYEGGTSLGGTVRSAHLADQAGMVTIDFTDASRGTITFPGESPKAISKFAWGAACE